ncbi:MAG: hypothetical protein DLM69_09915 [Candidatus Chloroheliales bacterium]|nr:MAG: hypothetical protein DLM69_09915 [Chloroflexota bacterium]
MIKNEESYQATKEWIICFGEQLATPLPENDPIDPRARQIQRDAIKSMIENLRAQVAEYEARQQQLQPAGRG